MASDDPIEPIHRDAPTRVPPVEEPRVPYSHPVAPAQAPPTEELADPLERASITDGKLPDEPTNVVARAAIHDAAMHHDEYARAIERAARESDLAADEQVPDPNSIGQVLGGAAASAYSGQSAQIDRSPLPGYDERTEHAEDITRELDPLAPSPRVTDEGV